MFNQLITISLGALYMDVLIGFVCGFAVGVSTTLIVLVRKRER